jgi:hypothetical protein
MTRRGDIRGSWSRGGCTCAGERFWEGCDSDRRGRTMVCCCCCWNGRSCFSLLPLSQSSYTVTTYLHPTSEKEQSFAHGEGGTCTLIHHSAPAAAPKTIPQQRAALVCSAQCETCGARGMERDGASHCTLAMCCLHCACMSWVAQQVEGHAV